MGQGTQILERGNAVLSAEQELERAQQRLQEGRAELQTAENEVEAQTKAEARAAKGAAAQALTFLDCDDTSDEACELMNELKEIVEEGKGLHENSYYNYHDDFNSDEAREDTIEAVQWQGSNVEDAIMDKINTIYYAISAFQEIAERVGPQGVWQRRSGGERTED